MKKCSDCYEIKSLEDFYSAEKHSKKKGNYTYYYPYCKKCTVKRTVNWIDNNKEKRKVSKHRYDTSEKGKKVYREFGRRFRSEGKYREWQNNNKDKVQGYADKRNMHKSHDITDKELAVLYNFCESSCMYCGLTEEEHLSLYKQRLHKDHAINDGSDKIDNCVLACKVCNSSKGSNDWNVWYTENNKNFTLERYNSIAEWLEISENILNNACKININKLILKYNQIKEVKHGKVAD